MFNTFRRGDEVTHFRVPERVGTVIEVEPDRYSFTDVTYHVAWSDDGPAIPYRNGLVHAGMCTIHNNYHRSCRLPYGHHDSHIFDAKDVTVSVIVLRPGSNNNPHPDKYSVCEYQAWLKFADGDATELPVISVHDTYTEAEEATTELNGQPTPES